MLLASYSRARYAATRVATPGTSEPRDVTIQHHRGLCTCFRNGPLRLRLDRFSFFIHSHRSRRRPIEPLQEERAQSNDNAEIRSGTRVADVNFCRCCLYAAIIGRGRYARAVCAAILQNGDARLQKPVNRADASGRSRAIPTGHLLGISVLFSGLFSVSFENRGRVSYEQILLAIEPSCEGLGAARISRWRTSSPRNWIAAGAERRRFANPCNPIEPSRSGVAFLQKNATIFCVGGNTEDRERICRTKGGIQLRRIAAEPERIGAAISCSVLGDRDRVDPAQARSIPAQRFNSGASEDSSFGWLQMKSAGARLNRGELNCVSRPS